MAKNAYELCVITKTGDKKDIRIDNANRKKKVKDRKKGGKALNSRQGAYTCIHLLTPGKQYDRLRCGMAQQLSRRAAKGKREKGKGKKKKKKANNSQHKSK